MTGAFVILGFLCAQTSSAIVEVEDLPEPTKRIAVRDLEVSGMNPRLGRVATDALVVELRKYKRVSVIGMVEVRELLAAEVDRQISGCDDESSCLGEIAEALGADVLITGDVARVGEETVLALRKLDQRTATGVGVTRRVTAKNGEEVLAIMGEAVAELFPKAELRAGQTVGVSPTVTRLLNPPPLDPPVFWSGAALGVVLASATTAVGAVNLVAFDNWTSLKGEVDKTRLEQQEGLVNATAIAFWSGVAATGLVAIASAGLAGITDWEGIRAQK